MTTAGKVINWWLLLLYPVQAFKALYHTRWHIEEGYKRQKSWLEIENFTGKSVLSVQHDDHARILSLNLTAIAVFAAQRHCDRTLPQRQYRYQINFAQALSTKKDTIVKCLNGLVLLHDTDNTWKQWGKVWQSYDQTDALNAKNAAVPVGNFIHAIKECRDYNVLGLS